MSVVTSVLAVFTAIGSWFAETVQSLIPMFYDSEAGLTFIGVLSVCALGIGVIMLIINKITDFLRFR